MTTKYPRKRVRLTCAGCGATANSTKARTMKYPLTPKGWAWGGTLDPKGNTIAYWCAECYANGKAQRVEVR